MIEIRSNRSDFEYDIRSLVKAFYPKEDVFFHKIDVMDSFISENIDPLTFLIYLTIIEDYLMVCLVDGNYEQKYTSTVDNSDRKSTKNQLKRSLYHALAEHSKKELLWGTLTGIRPTKIPMQLLNEGKSEQEIHSIMKERYLASDEKINLTIDIAKREKKILEKIDLQRGYSLYIGIPFCPSTCLYCSFTSYPIASWKNRVDEYLNALKKEIQFTARQFAHKKLDTVYIGGGTPTTLSAEQMDDLLTTLENEFCLDGLLELTVEAGRPDSITREKLEVLKKHSVTRISINPQTMNQKTLQIIGRHHTIEQTKEAFYLARELGFDNINMDLILGLPEETLSDVEHTMEEMKRFRPDSLTIHSLAIKRAARLRMEQENYESLRIQNSNETMALTHKYAYEMGLQPYYLYRQKNMAGNLENVGYAIEEKAGIYNILIMEEKQSIIALGAGGASKFVFSDSHIERIENVKDVTNYIQRIDEMIDRKKSFCETNQI